MKEEEMVAIVYGRMVAIVCITQHVTEQIIHRNINKGNNINEKHNLSFLFNI